MSHPENFGFSSADVQPDNVPDSEPIVDSEDLMLLTESAEVNSDSAEKSEIKTINVQKNGESNSRLNLAVLQSIRSTTEKMRDSVKTEQSIKENTELTKEEKEEAIDKHKQEEIRKTHGEIRKSVSHIAPVTVEEIDGKEKKTSDLDDYIDGRGINGFYEDYLHTQNIEDETSRKEAEDRVKDKLGAAVGDEHKEEAYKTLTSDENLERQYYALFQEKMRVLRKLDTDLVDKLDEKLGRKDLSSIEKLKEIDKIFDEAADKYESIKELHGLSKTIDRKVGVPSLIEAYEAARAKGISDEEFEKSLEEMSGATNFRFEPKLQPEAVEGARILKDVAAFHETLSSGEYVKYLGNGEYKGDMKGSADIYFKVDFRTREVTGKYLKHGEQEINIRDTDPEFIGVNEAMCKLIAIQIGAESLAEDDVIMREMSKDSNETFMDENSFLFKKEALGAILGCRSNDIKISPEDAEAQFRTLKINSKGYIKQIIGKLFEWFGNNASNAAKLKTLRMSMEPEDLQTLVSLWTENEDGTPKSEPTFDTMITFRRIRKERAKRLELKKQTNQ